MNMEVQRSPVFSPRMIENHAGQPCYLVEYDEDQWLKYDKAGQEHCFETWAKKAKPMGAQFVVLKLVPDPVFPSSDKIIPYVFRSYPVELETFNPVTVTVKLTAAIDADTWGHASEGDRYKLKLAARQQLAMHAMASPGCSYEICTREGKEPRTVEKGRL
jgi:hypothetical protein